MKPNTCMIRILSMILLLTGMMAGRACLAQNARVLIESVDAILVTEADEPNISKATSEEKKRIEQKLTNYKVQIETELKNSNLDAETRSLLSDRAFKLEMRINYCKGMPRASSKSQCEQCRKNLTEYFSSAFFLRGQTADPELKRSFMILLRDCIGLFLDEPTYYDDAMAIFADLSKQAALDTVINQIIDSTKTLETILDGISDSIKVNSIKWREIQEILWKYIEDEKESGEFIQLLDELLQKNDIPQVLQALRKIEASFQDSAAIASNAGRYALTIPIKDTMDAKLFLKPLQQFIHEARDETLLRNVFIRLREQIKIDTTTSDMTRQIAIEHALKQIFREENKSYIDKKTFERLLKTGLSINMMETSVRIHTPKRDGEPIKLTQPPYGEILKTKSKEVWGIDTLKNEASMQIDPSLVDGLFQKVPGNQIGLSFGEKLERQTLHIFSKFEVVNNKLLLQQCMVDGADGVILGHYSENIGYIDNKTQFSREAAGKIQTMREQFFMSIDGFRRLEQMTGDDPLNYISFEKVKAYQLYGVQMRVHRNPKAGEQLYLYADGIHVMHPFIINSSSTQYNGFVNYLKEELDNRKTLLNLAIYYSKTPGPNSISISGKYFPEQENRLDILLENKSIPVLSIELYFSKPYNDVEISNEEKQYLARYAIESIQALLATNIVYPHEDTVSRQLSCRSLLFAGSAQFALADRIRTPQFKNQKKWGYAYAGCELALLIGAGVFDQMAISQVDNDYLDVRNILLAAAGAVAIKSAYHAWRDIGRLHKKRP